MKTGRVGLQTSFTRAMMNVGAFRPRAKVGLKVRSASSAASVSRAGCLAHIADLLPTLRQETARKVGRYVLDHPAEVLHLTVTELAERAGVSDASVVRFCQQIGYAGFHDFKLSLAQDMVSPLQRVHEDLEPGDAIETIVQKVFSSEMRALEDTLKVLDPRAVQQAVEALSSAERVFLFAVGNSMPVAMDLHYRLIRIGVHCVLPTDAAVQHMSAALMTSRDVALAISHSGSSKDTVRALEIAGQAGATTICITNHSRSPITKVAKICLFTASRETLVRDEAMASRIAELAIVDALYVGVALRNFERSMEAARTTAHVTVDRKF